MKFDFLTSQVDDNPIAALCMIVFGVIILSLQDGLIKYMATSDTFIIAHDYDEDWDFLSHDDLP